VRAADVSNWSGVISRTQASCLREHGIERLVCGTQRPMTTRAQVAAATTGGIACEAYVFLGWSRPAAAQVRDARAAIDGLPVARLWLDCEDAPGVATPARDVVVASIREAADACAGIASGIYTRRSWWLAHTGDAHEFSARGLPLWDARYIAREGAPMPTFAPYGGWTRAAMTQWHDTTVVCGVSVCLDEVEEDAMMEADVRQMQRDIEQMRDGIGELLRHAAALSASVEARSRETALLLALILDGRAGEARRRLMYAMAAAGQRWPGEL
jgi:hypothetical protein